jgi:hypothetical protein
MRMWMLDVAREQCVSRELLFRYATETLDAGYDALGLYLEHRFAYPSTPWSHGTGVLTPETIRAVRSEFPSLRLVPFINLLGHVEGFLYTEPGHRWAEEEMKGLQACPSNPDFVRFAEGILDDTLAIFDDEWVHIGGDETAQLGKCPTCQARVDAHPGDGKAELYAQHFGPLAERVVRAGRTPAVWGDMFLEHHSALAAMPRETVLFDWQYFNGVAETAAQLGAHGHRVVGCPALHVYNAAWMHLGPSDENVRQVARDVQALNLEGVCLTTWETTMFSSYDTLLPAVRAARAIMDDPEGAPSLLSAYDSEWANLMGVALNELGGVWGHSRHRHKLKSRMFLYADPFLASQHHAEELCGPVGDQALALVDRAFHATDDEAEKGIALVCRSMMEFVRMAHVAHQLYAEGQTERAVSALAPTRYLFETLERTARRTHERIGGSLADIERARRAKAHVETVIQRIRQYGDGSLGYVPAWNVLTHPNFMPHDQASWWIVNAWGRP